MKQASSLFVCRSTIYLTCWSSLTLSIFSGEVQIGASLSGLAAGVIVDHLGYSAAFLTLGAAAGVALIVFALEMPETAEPETAPLQS